ncbi:ECF transporter S component [Caldicellulosiruptoraceae bacterium PP1]
MMNKKLRKMITVSIFGVVSFIIMQIEFPLGIFPDFLKFDFSDVVALIIGFSFGPISGVGVELIKNLLHLLMTKTAGIGEMANFLIGSVFVYTAAFIYVKNKSKYGAFISLIIGTLVFSLFAGLLNYYVLLPLYEKALKFPISAIVGIASKVNSLVKDKWTLILFSIIPFNIFKGIFASIVTILLYKRLSPIIKKYS